MARHTADALRRSAASPHPPARITSGCVGTPLCAPPAPHWSLRSLAPCAVAPRYRRTAPPTVPRASFGRHVHRVRALPRPRPVHDPTQRRFQTSADIAPERAGQTVPRQDVTGRCGLSRHWRSVAPTPLRSLSATRPAQRPLRLPCSTHCAFVRWRAYPEKDSGQAHRSHMLSLFASRRPSASRTMWRYMPCRGLVKASAAPVPTYRPSRGATIPVRRATAARVKR